MKWDWHTYDAQPSYFVDIIVKMLRNEAEESQRRSKAAS